MATRKCQCGKDITFEDDAPTSVHVLRWNCSRNKVRSCLGGEAVTIVELVVPPAPFGFMWDHIDGNIHNNLKSNLRIATRSQNGANRRLGSNNTSGFKEVSWNTAVCKWLARIMVNGSSQHLGYFNDPVRAAFEYNVAATQHFGEFAHLNVLPWPNGVLQGPPKQSDIPRSIMQITP